MAAAAQIHGMQPRKGTTTPYLSHLLGTCAIALDYGANEDEASPPFSTTRSRSDRPAHDAALIGELDRTVAEMEALARDGSA